jgi:hypothetical protein
MWYLGIPDFLWVWVQIREQWLFRVKYLFISVLGSSKQVGRAMANAVGCRALAAEAWFRALVSPREICGGQSGTGTGFSGSFWGFPCRCHSTVALHTHVSRGEWTIGSLVAEIQRRSLTLSTRTTRKVLFNNFIRSASLGDRCVLVRSLLRDIMIFPVIPVEIRTPLRKIEFNPRSWRGMGYE